MKQSISKEMNSDYALKWAWRGIFVENCVVEICNNGMFLQFYELTLEMKYCAGYINGIELYSIC